MHVQNDIYQSQTKTSQATLDVASAFYKIFRTFSKEDRFAITQYILADEDMQKTSTLSEVPNEATIQAFTQNQKSMTSLDSIDALREDILS